MPSPLEPLQTPEIPDIIPSFGTVTSAVPLAALHWASSALEEFIQQQLTGEPAEGMAFGGDPVSPRVLGFTGVVGKLGAVALYLMGLPAVANLARQICGADALPTHDWMVIKNPGDGRRIEWHQDFTHDRRHPAISVGIHLDELNADALRVIPGTQSSRQDLCALRERYDYDSAGVTALRVSAGGLVWHDVMLVHGSPALPAAAPPRKTYYIEFRSATAVAGHPGFSANYTAVRRRLFTAAQALNHRLGATPSGSPFAILHEQERALVSHLRTVSARLDVANYCTPLPH